MTTTVSTYLGQQNVSYTNWYWQDWKDSKEVKCMQLLSGTDFEGIWVPYDCSNSTYAAHVLCQLRLVHSFKIFLNLLSGLGGPRAWTSNFLKHILNLYL